MQASFENAWMKKYYLLVSAIIQNNIIYYLVFSHLTLLPLSFFFAFSFDVLLVNKL